MFDLQGEAGTAKHFLQIIDNAESDYQVFLTLSVVSLLSDFVGKHSLAQNDSIYVKWGLVEFIKG